MKAAIFAIFLGGALGLGQSVDAGSVADPVIEADVIVQDAGSSSSGTALVAFLALILAIPALD